MIETALFSPSILGKKRKLDQEQNDVGKLFSYTGEIGKRSLLPKFPHEADPNVVPKEKKLMLSSINLHMPKV